VNDCQSLVSVTPDTGSLTTISTGSSSISDIEDSLSDLASLFDDEEARCHTRSPLRRTGSDSVARQRLERDPQQKDTGYQTFDGKEMATMRMLELELLAADLSRQMMSMHKLMRLLSCDTSRLGRLVDYKGRRGVRHTALSRARREHGELLETWSDNDHYVHDAKTVAARGGEADVSMQKASLSAAIDELKTVSRMMSSTLQSVTASRYPVSSVLTAHDGAARNNNDKKNTELSTMLDDVYQCSADSYNWHLERVSSAATDDDDDDDDGDHDADDDENDETCTTEVSARYSL